MVVLCPRRSARADDDLAAPDRERDFGHGGVAGVSFGQIGKLQSWRGRFNCELKVNSKSPGSANKIPWHTCVLQSRAGCRVELWKTHCVATFNALSPALVLCQQLQEAGINAVIHDESVLERFWFMSEPLAAIHVEVRQPDYLPAAS